MKANLTKLLESTLSANKLEASSLFNENRRLQRNIERVAQCADLTSATLAGVIVDHRVIEVLGRLEVRTRKLVLAVEQRLGRKLSRERTLLLLNNLQRVQQQSARERAVKAFLAHYETKNAA